MYNVHPLYWCNRRSYFKDSTIDNFENLIILLDSPSIRKIDFLKTVGLLLLPCCAFRPWPRWTFCACCIVAPILSLNLAFFLSESPPFDHTHWNHKYDNILYWYISMTICHLIYRKVSAISGRKKNRREDTCTWLYWWNRLFQYLSVVKKILFKSVFFDHLNESGIYDYNTQNKNYVRRKSNWVEFLVLASPTSGILILNYAEEEKRTLVKWLFTLNVRNKIDELCSFNQ